MPIPITQAAFSSFYPDIASSAPGAPEPLIDSVLRSVCIAFCSDTFYVQKVVTLSNMNPVSLASYFALPAVSEANQEILQVLSVRIPDRPPLTVSTQAFVETAIPTWAATPGTPQLYFIPEPGDISFYPGPTVAGNVSVDITAATKPTRTATSVDSVLQNDFYDEIVAGVLTRLMLMPEKPWTNLKLAAVHGRTYQKGVSAAKIAVNRAFTSAGISVDLRRVA